MLVRVTSKFGGEPVELEASQVIVFNDHGTPLVVAGEYGPAGGINVSRAGDGDFNRVLKTFGYAPVGMDLLKASDAPNGAKILVAP